MAVAPVVRVVIVPGLLVLWVLMLVLAEMTSPVV